MARPRWARPGPGLVEAAGRSRGPAGPGQEGPGQEGPSQEGPGQEGPGQEGPGQEGPGQAGLAIVPQFVALPCSPYA